TATDDWVGADSVAAATAGAPSAPNWLRVQAVATGAAARAARGGVDAADRALADAAVGAPPDVARWYERARLLLADAAGRASPSVGRPPTPTSTSGTSIPRWRCWSSSCDPRACRGAPSRFEAWCFRSRTSGWRVSPSAWGSGPTRGVTGASFSPP